jgi:hypothetical protein
MEEATMLRVLVKHMYKCQISGSSVEPWSKQSNSMLVSKSERKMLEKLVGSSLKVIDKNRVASTTLTKLAYALTSKMTGESVEYEDNGYDEEDVCADYYTSVASK